jgi:hypothetical protein
VLLTRSPLIHPTSEASSFDLHVLSTPPAFILSQDQTLRKKLQTQHRHPGKRANGTALNPIKAKNTRQPPHGTRQPADNLQPKKFGINKLGTLLSSQTTGTPGTRNNPSGPPHRSGATFQTYPLRPVSANPPKPANRINPAQTRTPPRTPGHGKTTVSQAPGKGFPPRLSGGDSENNTPRPPRTQIHNQHPVNTYGKGPAERWKTWFPAPRRP